MSHTDSRSDNTVEGGQRVPSEERAPLISPRRWRTIRYVTLRLLAIIPSLFFAATFTFFLVNLVPSDPVAALLGDLATPDQIAAKRAELGLDKSVWEQYLAYIAGLVQGQLGNSFVTGEPIGEIIIGRLPSTLVITVPAIAIAAVLGVYLGVAQASSKRPRFVRGIVTVFQSLPSFVLGVIGILVLVSFFKLLPPPTGQIGISTTPPPSVTGAVVIDAMIAGNLPAFFSALAHMVLPVMAMAIVLAVPFARISASAVGSNLASEFTMFTGGNGLAKRQVVGNARRAARTPIIVVSGIVTAEVVGGAVIIERLFAWNGLGRWGLEAILDKDLPAIQGFVLFSTGLTIIVYLASDIISTVLDPRLK